MIEFGAFTPIEKWLFIISILYMKLRSLKVSLFDIYVNRARSIGVNSQMKTETEDVK